MQQSSWMNDSCLDLLELAEPDFQWPSDVVGQRMETEVFNPNTDSSKTRPPSSASTSTVFCTSPEPLQTIEDEVYFNAAINTPRHGLLPPPTPTPPPPPPYPSTPSYTAAPGSESVSVSPAPQSGCLRFEDEISGDLHSLGLPFFSGFDSFHTQAAERPASPQQAFGDFGYASDTISSHLGVMPPPPPYQDPSYPPLQHSSTCPAFQTNPTMSEDCPGVLVESEVQRPDSEPHFRPSSAPVFPTTSTSVPYVFCQSTSIPTFLQSLVCSEPQELVHNTGTVRDSAAVSFVPQANPFPPQATPLAEKPHEEELRRDEVKQEVSIPDDLDPRLAKAAKESMTTGQMTPLIKEELRLSILQRRHSRGQDEPVVSFSPPQKYELTTEEKERNRKRKAMNREAAARHRQKKKILGQRLQEEYKQLEEKNKALQGQMALLEAEKATMLSLLIRTSPP